MSLLARGVLASVGLVATTPTATAESSTQRVEIVAPTAPTAYDDQLFRYVVTRAEIERHGDTTMVDVLRRVPGVTVDSSFGRASEIRLRGLGHGYTRILLNGLPAPPGFSMDALLPGTVERIEVQRVPTADAQGVAGTINIILRSTAASSGRTMQIGAASQSAQPALTADLRWTHQREEKSWHLTAGVRRELLRTEVRSSYADYDLFANSIRASRGIVSSDTASTTSNVGSGFRVKRANGSGWSVETSLRHRTISSNTLDVRSPATAGESTNYREDLKERLRTASATLKAATDIVFDNRSQMALAASLGGHRRTAISESEVLFATDATVRNEESVVRSQDTSHTGRYRLGVSDVHDLVVGWEVELSKRRERRTFLATPALVETDVDLPASVDKRVLYAQNDWSFAPNASAYFGLRVESLRVRSSVPSTRIDRTYALISPILQAAMPLRASKDLRVTVGIARTFKSPNPRDLIPVRWSSPNNSSTEPDEQGNELLRPESAWGLDAALEATFSAGSLRASAYGKRIDDVVGALLTEQEGRWVVERENLGRAEIAGVEIDATVDQRKLFPECADVRWTLYAAGNRSRLHTPSGERLSLDIQAPVSMRVGFEHKPRGAGWRWGAQVLAEGKSSSSTSPPQTTSKAARSTVDLFWSYTTAAKHVVRLSATNVLGSNVQDRSLYESLPGRSERVRVERVEPTLKASWRFPL
jgi:outer membrane receptor protein involved in Fe transport